jgi:pseudouridine-5'-phosphate glycosidase
MLAIAAEVRAAVLRGQAVVALESTVIAHGLPWPENVQVAAELEALVREGGAVPATVAVLDGQLRVGLDADERERLGRGGVVKAGAGDLAMLLASGGSGATTVSATLVAAARAGIAVFATGGIGGVHRGDAWDVSSDLTTLARERVAVVSAGAKSILDLPRTLEALETLGVPVIGYQTSEFPAFYARESGLALEHRADDATRLASLLRAHWRTLSQPGGVLVANPIPAADALPRGEIDTVIADALAEADRRAVRGKALTPFLLAELRARTSGRSVAANLALLRANVRLAAAIAVAYARAS